MKKRITGVLTVSAMLAAGAAAYRAINRLAVREALSRQEPKLIEEIKAKKGYPFASEEIIEHYRGCQTEMEETPHETVEIRAEDGTLLVGHLFPAEQPKRVIIAMHGWRSSWSWDFCGIWTFLRNCGCTVLYAEQRGQGNSGGDFMGFGMLERHDCLSWARWLNENGGAELPVYLVGVSMGATTVLMAAGLPNIPQNVRGVIADCGFTSAKAIWKSLSERGLGMPYAILEPELERQCRHMIHMGTEDCSAPDALRNTKLPVLFIHGADDHFVPVQMTMENYEACRSPKKLLIVPGADHGLSYVVDRPAYENAVMDFFAEQEEKTRE